MKHHAKKKKGGAPDNEFDNPLIVDLEGEKNIKDEKTTGSFLVDMGVHILIAAVAVAVLVIFVILPEFSHKPTVPIALDTLGPTDFIIVPNNCVKNNTKVERINRITGDRQRLNCQDCPIDDIVLATRDTIDGDIVIMVQGNHVPMHSELIDLPWIPQVGARSRAEQLGYLIVV